MPAPGGGGPCSRGVWSRGVPAPGGGLVNPPRTATAAGGTHPTAFFMHTETVGMLKNTSEVLHLVLFRPSHLVKLSLPRLVWVIC